ncbi:dicarboxylate/amino acid:cation symporter [Clostridium sp. AF20-7]|jgi:Na+/H+-dicarboxylate symporter|uniref:Dicarboxylate/amino acid:cation symporter n=1 Tax=Clostridium fessum TaxID=2126740 RepID=A0A2T3FT81_9CLOT|nr:MULTISPECIES: dicarboxylate/amino acid:cation symporter [Clostridium]PST38469.1 dicarboxylate/amino acid:cation symporter [Clostridium fessum]RGH16624.1 dicarboxylate/amino acid:cation symporter [Clostridium sp. AF12-41]RHO09529.1 dicarboxylate/amino acid:cation symporter [Clostridium sp. AM18-55]RHR01449.1 dicarboxylate/amino acid:cation symporter [Clostridium sp. AF20-7]
MVEKTKNGAEKKETPLYVKIFIALFAGIAFGYVLNFMGGVENEIINGYVLPFFQFIGDLFIKLIKMIVVPLVFFCIIDAALSLGDIKKLRSIGVKTIIWFLATGGISATIGLILANIIKPGRGLQLGTAETAMEVKELPGIYQTLLDLIPSNPFQALTSGEMMQIIVFSLFLGFAIISIGKEAQQLCDIISLCSRTMFKVIDMILGIIPYGVFSLMTVALAKYGVAIFGPVLKFILTDYLACITMSIVGYSIFLSVIGKVNPMKFWRKAFEPWMIAFSTCTSSAALPVSMEVAPKKMGVPRDIASFVLPLGCTAQMNGTCAYFGIVVLFAAQLYGVELSIQQQIMLVVQATFLSVGCAATPQIGLVISLTLMTQMGLPLDAYALVAGIYRIIDQIHTSTNSVGDLVASVCISQMEGELDHEIFNQEEAKKAA